MKTLTLALMVAIGVAYGVATEGADPRAHMDGGQVMVMENEFYGVTYWQERPHKSDRRCWSGVHIDYERAPNEPGAMLFGIPANVMTECYIA